MESTVTVVSESAVIGEWTLDETRGTLSKDAWYLDVYEVSEEIGQITAEHGDNWLPAIRKHLATRLGVDNLTLAEAHYISELFSTAVLHLKKKLAERIGTFAESLSGTEGSTPANGHALG